MRRPTRRVSRSAAGNATVIIFLLIFGMFMILPLYYMVVSALKPTSGAAPGPRFWRSGW